MIISIIYHVERLLERVQWNCRKISNSYAVNESERGESTCGDESGCWLRGRWQWGRFRRRRAHTRWHRWRRWRPTASVLFDRAVVHRLHSSDPSICFWRYEFTLYRSVFLLHRFTLQYFLYSLSVVSVGLLFWGLIFFWFLDRVFEAAADRRTRALHSKTTW